MNESEKQLLISGIRRAAQGVIAATESSDQDFEESKTLLNNLHKFKNHLPETERNEVQAELNQQ